MTEQFGFKRARRAQARLRLGVSAVSGGGKTMGALRLAKGIVQALIDTGQIEGGIDGKIAVIDTERKSASLYAHVVPFDTLEMEPPYSVDRMQQALMAAERAGYAVCIIDQISHAWAGPGGQLEWIDTLKASAKNAISPWAKITPVQQEFYDRLLRTPMHMICTMRAKSEWVIEDVVGEGGRVKKVPKKIGLSPVQREGIEYEFTTMLDVELESHMATASKDRTGLFMDKQTRLDEETGRKLAEWLITGEKADAAQHDQASNANAAAEAQRAADLKALTDGVDDLELSFVDCKTLPDLADQFHKAQTFVKSFVAKLGAEEVKPFLDRVVAAKEARKTAIGNPAAGQDELSGLERVTPDDVVKLEKIATDNGFTPAQAYEILGVKRFGDVARGSYAIAVEKLQAAGKAKGQKPPARRKVAA